LINLNYRDSRPIYEQIMEGVIGLMFTGGLSAGDKLPSVRELATQLAINPNTIQRAYRELEAAGYIFSVPGKGSFASGDIEVLNRRKYALLEQFDKTVFELKRLDISMSELIERIKGEA